MNSENKNMDIENFMAAPKPGRKTAGKKTDKIKKTRKIKFSKKIVAIIVIVLVFVGALGTAGYFYYQYKKVTSADAAKNEAAGYVAKISKFMVLPEDETPTLATVADKDKLSYQAFFAKAQNGDKVLIYAKAQKAILYRPSTNMIIEAVSTISPIVNNAPASQEAQTAPEIQNTTPATPAAPAETPETQAQAPETPKTATVAVYNGTSQKGVAKSIAGKLAVISGVNVIATGNSKGTYEKTTVIDLTGNNSDLAQKIADAIGGVVGTLPAGENNPSADILVIGGTDLNAQR